MKHLLFALFLLIYFPIFAQNIGKDDFVEDLTFLSDRIKQYNPALSHYHPEFDRLSAQVIRQTNADSVTIFEYFSAVSRICALANEGHFKIGSRDDRIRKGIMANTAAYLPLQVTIISGRVFVVGDFSNEHSIGEGEEITAINGIKMPLLLEKLLEVTPSDGEILTYAHRKIQDRFSVLFYFHIEQADTFEITLLDENKKERRVTINALVRSDQIKNLEKNYVVRNKESSSTAEGFYSLAINDTYALLTLPSFDFRRVNKYKVKSKKLYKTLFKELQDKKVQHLVVDLRDNTGGRNAFADDMVPFILKSPSSDPYLKKTISWEGKSKIYKMPAPSKWAFQGAIYVLINGKTFSAGSSLARFLKEYGNATVIGTETGTRYEGFAAGSTQDINLPNTGLNIGIPRYHILYPASAKQKTSNRGLLPDHEINATFEAYDQEIDLHIKKVRALIQQE